LGRDDGDRLGDYLESHRPRALDEHAVAGSENGAERGETLLHGSGRISLGRSVSDPLATTIVFRRDQRALYRV